MEKGEHFDRVFPRNSAGIWLAMRGEQIVVRATERTKLGFLSGVRNGDILVAIDGESMRGKTAYAAERILRERPEGRRLNVERPPEPELTEITLRRAATAGERGGG